MFPCHHSAVPGEVMPEISEDDFKALQEKAARVEEIAKANEDFKRDMFRFKEEAKAKADELAKIQSQRAEEEKRRLVETEQYKSLYEKSEAEKAAAEAAKEEALATAHRYMVTRELKAEALRAGMREEALPDLDLLGLDELEVKREGNAVAVKGVPEFLTKVKKTRPHWFSDHKPPVFHDPKGGNPGEGRSYTPQELFELKKKDPAAYIDARKKMMLKGK